MIIQSSSAVTVLVVGFVNAGLMTLKQALGVIYGANIGTTMTGQIMRLKITDYALPIIAIV
jgi:phosphate:Na+ symporter